VLSDTERRRLAEIEFWFETNDPRLVRRFARRRNRLSGLDWFARHRWVVVALVTFAVAAAVGAGVLTRDVPAGIVGAIAVLTVAGGCWLVRRRARRWSAPPTG
jgi:protein-S-isoprenylcysteine O-methyltransferase Ste14